MKKIIKSKHETIQFSCFKGKQDLQWLLFIWIKRIEISKSFFEWLSQAREQATTNVELETSWQWLPPILSQTSRILIRIKLLCWVITQLESDSSTGIGEPKIRISAHIANSRVDSDSLFVGHIGLVQKCVPIREQHDRRLGSIGRQNGAHALWSNTFRYGTLVPSPVVAEYARHATRELKERIACEVDVRAERWTVVRVQD